MNNRIQPRYFIGIFIISFATLLLELSLTRVLSVSLWYHFGFLIISTALLGFGAAGVSLSVSRWLREKADLDRSLTVLSLGFALSTVFCFWLMQKIPFEPFSLMSDKKQILYMPLYYLVVIVPFYFSGLVIGLLLTRSASGINRLYAFDLLGAGLGCGAIAWVMPHFGGSGSVVISASLGAVTAIVFSWTTFRSWAYVSAIASVGLFVLSFYASFILPIQVSVNKGPRLKRLPPTYSAWNTFSKIDYYQRPRDTITDFPPFHLFVIDRGTASTSIVDLSEGIDKVLTDMKTNPKIREWCSELAEVAALGKKAPKVLIIGSGAGSEILESLMIGASSVTAVELNPIIADIQSNRFKKHWGGLLDRPEVNLVVDEGRNFIKRSAEKYDVIISSHTISNAAVASGSLSLAENYVLTKEALAEYMEHLTPDGVVFFTRPELQISRLFSTATEILLENGQTSPGDHLYAYTLPDPRDKDEKYKFAATFLMKKSPLKPEEINLIEGLIADTTAFAPRVLYSPTMSRNPDNIYQLISTSQNLKKLYATHPQLLQPATDDKPFFNQHAKWSSISWSDFTEIFTQDKRSRLALEDRPIAEITLTMILAQSLLIAGILILVPLWKFSRQGLMVTGRWRYLTYFACLGFGFILVEIALLQRFNLYLGQPVYTYAVILASLLMFTGVGSYLSERWITDVRGLMFRLLPVMLITLVATTLLLPVIFDSTLHLPLFARIIISVVLVAPLGLVLGIPFPFGMHMISQHAPALAPWAWGVNGFFTVIGSVSAMILGMAFGFKVVLILAGCCYVAAASALYFLGAEAKSFRKETAEGVSLAN